MAELAAAPIGAPNQQTEQPEEKEEEAPRGSFLDPDVILVLSLAVLIDILDVTVVLGWFLNLILGIPIILWMVWKTGRLWSAVEQGRRVHQAPRLRQEFTQKRQQELAMRRLAARRAWRRALLFFLAGLVPILSIFVLWTWAVISTVRGK